MSDISEPTILSTDNLLDWWQDESKIISGATIITDYLGLTLHWYISFDTSVHKFWATFESILEVNPGYEEASTRFEENNYGLKKVPTVISYYRNKKINQII